MTDTNSRLRVAVTRRLPEPVEARLAALFDVTLNEDDHHLTREELVAALQNNDAIVPSLADRIDGPLLDQAGPRL